MASINPAFRKKSIIDARPRWRDVKRVLVRFAVGAPVLAGIVLAFDPENFLDMPRNEPTLWVMILCLYPIFSALPQEFLYRTFFFYRYESWFTRNGVIRVNMLLFCGAHLLFWNWQAPVLTLLAG